MSRDLNFPQASEAFKRMNAGILGGLGSVGMPKTPSAKKPESVAEVKEVGCDIDVSQGGACKFVIPGAPMGKPRMTQRDKWAKRPVVVRYRAWADKAREIAPEQMSKAPHEVNWTAYIAMPESWPKKKKTAMEGRPHRAKPDRDNIDKAILDSLWESDSCVSDGVIRKRWCWAGEERLEVEVIG